MKPKVDIDYVCGLANLRLSQKEKSLLIPQMEKIVKWVDKLEEIEIDVSRAEIYTPVTFLLPFRKDEVKVSLSTEEALANSPEKDASFMKVPKVIEEK